VRPSVSASVIAVIAAITVVLLSSGVGAVGSTCVTWGYNAQHTNVSSENMSSNKGGIAWTYAVNGAWLAAPPAVDADGYMICGDSTGLVAALNASTGSILWHSQVPYGVESVPAIAPNGMIYITSNNVYRSPPNGQGALSALRPNGSVLWSTEFNGTLTAPTIANDGSIYVCEKGLMNPEDSRLYSVAPNGTIKWSSEPKVTFCPSPALGKDGTIYASFQNNPVIAFFPNGIVKWSAVPITDSGPVGRIMNTGGIAVGADGTVYAGAWNYSFSAYAPDGKVKWYRACQEEMTGGVAIAPDGTILVTGRGDGPYWSSALYAFNANGQLKWRYASTSAFLGSPCVSADGLIFVPASTKEAYFGDTVIVLTLDGKVSWKMAGFGMWDTDDNYAPITLGPNHTIFMPAMGPSQSRLYAVNVGTPTAPQDLKARIENNHVRLSWSPPPRDGGSPISAYKVYRAQLMPNSNILSGEYLLVATLDGNARYYVDHDVTPNPNGVVEFAYQVQTVNSYGDGLIAEVSQIDSSSVSFGPFVIQMVYYLVWILPLLAVVVIIVVLWNHDKTRGRLR
jgi:hypothetical protein